MTFLDPVPKQIDVTFLCVCPEYGRARDSDSESSGSPCAACAAELYRLPAAHLAGKRDE